mmetsp:Transcript_36773/g.78381  ORF Transcript_36773/g.78381 Transcript_36773/m.78381 type:complete len:130 (+) Transcript_36773:674-1063(+)
MTRPSLHARWTRAASETRRLAMVTALWSWAAVSAPESSVGSRMSSAALARCGHELHGDGRSLVLARFAPWCPFLWRAQALSPELLDSKVAGVVGLQRDRRQKSSAPRARAFAKAAASDRGVGTNERYRH